MAARYAAKSALIVVAALVLWMIVEDDAGNVSKAQQAALEPTSLHHRWLDPVREP